jgi:hypothetical protein
MTVAQRHPRSPSVLPSLSFTKYQFHCYFLKSLSRQISLHPFGLYCRKRFVSHIVSSIQIFFLQSQSIYLVVRFIVLGAVMLKMGGFVDASTIRLLNMNSCRILEEAYSIRRNMPEDSKLLKFYFIPHKSPFCAVF